MDNCAAPEKLGIQEVNIIIHNIIISVLASPLIPEKKSTNSLTVTFGSGCE